MLSPGPYNGHLAALIAATPELDWLLADWLDNKAPQEWRVDPICLRCPKKQPPRWAKAARGSGERPRVFCASLLLTKRPENYKKLAPWKETPPNVWLGVTGENQEYYAYRRWGR